MRPSLILATGALCAALASCGPAAGRAISPAALPSAAPAPAPPPRAYGVWVIVPELRVAPAGRRRPTPLVQFTGDRAQLDRGQGQLAVLALPDDAGDGSGVTLLDDNVLWTDELRPDDPRTFALWLRDGGRGQAPDLPTTAAALSEDRSVIGGYRLPLQRALHVSRPAMREVTRGATLLHWSAPWRTVLAAAAAGLAQGREVVLRTRVVARRAGRGGPRTAAGAEATVVFVVRPAR